MFPLCTDNALICLFSISGLFEVKYVNMSTLFFFSSVKYLSYENRSGSFCFYTQFKISFVFWRFLMWIRRVAGPK